MESNRRNWLQQFGLGVAGLSIAQLEIFALPFFFILLLLSACNSNPNHSEIENNSVSPPVVIPEINYVLVNSYPHDTNSFTEGFLFHNGMVYESTGATEGLPQTRSLFGSVDMNTGKINMKAELDRKKYFGEGITFLNGKIFQLTYKTKIGFIYDAKTFKNIGTFSYPSKEGWGMTNDGKNLVMSDGTNTITYLDPDNFQVIKTLSVSENGYVKDYINELEFIGNYLYANIWTTNTIVKIDTSNGKITGKLDLTSLADDAKHIYNGSVEMNGIAYDSTSNKIFITGKMWPKIYEIKFNH